MSDLTFRVNHVIKTEIEVIESQLSRNGVDVLSGTASFVDQTIVQIVGPEGSHQVKAENIVIAVGTNRQSQQRCPSMVATSSAVTKF